MNNLYSSELMAMASDLDSDLEKIFSHYGFYESEKLSKKEFKTQLIKDYQEIFLSESEE